MSKIKYEIIFEERTIFDENYDELWLPNSVLGAQGVLPTAVPIWTWFIFLLF